MATPATIWPLANTDSRLPLKPVNLRASTSQASVAPEKKVNPRPSSTEVTAQAQNEASVCQASQYRTVETARVSDPSRNEARRPQVSATTPVGTSNSTMPAVNRALAANAAVALSPASSRNSVLMPQMNDAARVLNSTSTRYTRWTVRGSGLMVPRTYRRSATFRRPSAPGHAGPDLGAPQRRVGLWRLAPRGEGAQHLGRGPGDGRHRLLEHLLGGRGRAGDAADLADVLAGGGFDLLGGGGRLKAPQGGDVAAHAPDPRRDGSVPGEPSGPAGHGPAPVTAARPRCNGRRRRAEHEVGAPWAEGERGGGAPGAGRRARGARGHAPAAAADPGRGGRLLQPWGGRRRL